MPSNPQFVLMLALGYWPSVSHQNSSKAFAEWPSVNASSDFDSFPSHSISRFSCTSSADFLCLGVLSHYDSNPSSFKTCFSDIGGFGNALLTNLMIVRRLYFCRIRPIAHHEFILSRHLHPRCSCQRTIHKSGRTRSGFGQDERRACMATRLLRQACTKL